MRLILLCLSAAATAPTTSTASASSNLVSVAHQSYSKVYSTSDDPSHRIHIVKSEPSCDESYAASDFYRRVRDRRRLVHGRIGERGAGPAGGGDGDGPSRADDGAAVDHSLDHYFDHDIARPSAHGAVDRGSEKVMAATHAVSDGGRERVMAPAHAYGEKVMAGGHGGPVNPRRVRGGGSPSATTPGCGVHRETATTASRSHQIDEGRDAGSSHHRIHQASHVHPHRDDIVAEHHLGLLRVPCSIALNSNEASLGHQLSNQAEGRVNVQGELFTFDGSGPFCPPARGCRSLFAQLLFASAV